MVNIIVSLSEKIQTEYLLLLLTEMLYSQIEKDTKLFTGSNMLLHFKDINTGFKLFNDQEKGKSTDCEFGDYMYINKDGYIVNYFETFYFEKLNETQTIDVEINEYDIQIKNDKYLADKLYSIPELKIDNKYFKDVLMAIKDYYLKKAG